MKSINWLNLKRRVRFGDCDSANVIHFHNLLKWSHEAWEESMDKYGIPINEIFPDGISQEKTLSKMLVTTRRRRKIRFLDIRPRSTGRSSKQQPFSKCYCRWGCFHPHSLKRPSELVVPAPESARTGASKMFAPE